VRISAKICCFAGIRGLRYRWEGRLDVSGFCSGR
jgi:hypothetical protein